MKWIKKGHIFKPNGNFNWSTSHAQIPRALVLEDRVRIFYATRFFKNKLPISQTSYIDVDKKDLSKIIDVCETPSLNLGSKGSFSEFGIHPTMLINKNNNTHFFYQGWQRGKNYPYQTEIGLALSNDNGKSFKKKGNTPVLGISKFDPYYVNGVFIIENKEHYNMFYSSGKKWVNSDSGKKESVYQIKSATSKDLVNWSINDNFIIKEKFSNECQNSATVVKINNSYHMWFCYRKALDFRNKLNGYRIGYAISNDLVNWHRDDKKSGIDVSENVNDWDYEMVCYPYVFHLDNRIIMLYSGNKFGEAGFGYAEMKL